MTTRSEGLRSQVQDIVKQAVVQVEGVSGVVVRTVADRLDLDVDALRNRRNKMLRRLGKQSARLAEQDIPMPNVVRSTLGLVNNLLDGWVENLAEEPAQAHASESAAHASVADEMASEKGRASKANRSEGGTSRPRKSSSKGGARKPRRQPTTN